MINLSSPQYRLLAVVVLLAGAIWIALSAAPHGSDARQGLAAPQEGFQAPDFTLPDAGGAPVTLSELRGRPVLINFWATWCPPCQAEMPALQRVYQDYQERGFTILAINATNQDTAELAIRYAQENGLTFPVLLDSDGTAAWLYQIHSLPSSFFVDGDGVLQEVVFGGPMDEALLRTRVEQLFEGER